MPEIIILWAFIATGQPAASYAVSGFVSKEACEKFAETAPGKEMVFFRYKCMPYEAAK